jgi:hypothetical protein
MTEDPAVFDQLVRELDDEQRRVLLVRIQSSVPVYERMLQPEEDEESIFVADQELTNLNLLERIIFLFRSLFSRKDRYTLLVERYLKRLAAAIERDYPSLISFAAGRCSRGLQEELILLRAHVRSLYAPLHEVLGKRRGQFVAFLTRNQLQDFHKRLQDETDPQRIWDCGHFSYEKSVRAVMLQRFQDLIETISPQDRQRIGRDARAFFALYSFSRHSFEDLLSAFKGEEIPEAECAEVHKPLKELAASLEPVRIPPSAGALYDLFLFLHQEQLEDQNFDLEHQLMDDMASIHTALAGIRRFRDRVPLLGLLRVLTRDAGYYPAPHPASNWFSYFKEFWRGWVHHRYLEFFHSRTRSTLISEALEYLHGKSLPVMENYRADKFGVGIPVQHELSLSFIKGFLENVFAPLSRSLKIIYLNGEFYKEENRVAFTDAFLYLSGAGTKIQELESMLGPQGGLRAAIQTVKAQALGQRLRRKRIADILARADGHARTLLDAFLEQIEYLKALLYGILKGQPGDRYDTLVNLSKIGGRENSELRRAWTRALERSDQAAGLLKKIRELEINSSRPV